MLTIGGGYAPSSNQVSLEKNVLYFRELLDEAGLGRAPHDVLFAAGPNSGRHIQYISPENSVPRVNVLLGREICLRDGSIRALVAGQIEKLGTTYVLSVQIVDPAEGVKVASLSEQAPRNSIRASWTTPSS